MTKPLLKKFYFMSPVQVVKVTTHNIEQAAAWCGGEIKNTESRRNPGRIDKYIDVPVPKGAALIMAFPGMFITKRVVITLENEIKVTYGVFRKDFFEKNYWLEPVDAVDACWTRLENEEIKPEVVAGTNQTTAVLNVHVANPGQVGQALEAARKKLIENQDKAEIGVINVIAGTEAPVDGLKLPSEIVVSGSVDENGVLTPYQQRALITEDGVEEAVVPETANVVLPDGEDIKHPSLRGVDVELPAMTAMHPPLRGDVRDPFKFAGSSHDPMNIVGSPMGNELSTPSENTTMQEVLSDVAEKIDSGPEAGGVIIDSAVVGSAGRHRAGIAGHPDAEGRSEAEKVADKAAYDAQMKEIQDGDPDH